MASSPESHLDTSGCLYQTALDTLMDNLHISSTPKFETFHYKNNSHNHFSKLDEEKFFSYGSTSKRSSNTKVQDNKQTNCQNTNHRTMTSPALKYPDTPKRTIASYRKQKLFVNNEETEKAEDEEDGGEFKFKTRFTKTNKELSPQSLLLRKAIVRYECQQRRQERIALSKKSIRTSLRI